MEHAVIAVPPVEKHLDPETEVSVIRRLVNDHNKESERGEHKEPTLFRIGRQIFYTGYLIDSATSRKLLGFLPFPAPSSQSDLPQHHTSTSEKPQPSEEIKYLANNILIKPGPCAKEILNNIGGMGHHVRFETVSFGSLDDAIWAVRVAPVPRDAVIKPINEIPMVVLAHKKGHKPIDANYIKNWSDITDGSQRFTFDTKIGERSIFRIEPKDSRADHHNRNGYGAGNERNRSPPRRFSERGDASNGDGRSSPRRFDSWRDRKPGPQSQPHRPYRDPPGRNFGSGDRGPDGYQIRNRQQNQRTDAPYHESDHRASGSGRGYRGGAAAGGGYRGDYRGGRGGYRESSGAWRNGEPGQATGGRPNPRYGGDGPADQEQHLEGPESMRGNDIVMRDGPLRY